MARPSGDAADAGRQAVDAFRRRMAERIVEALSPDNPDAPPDVFRQVQRRPSLVETLGLTAIDLLARPDLGGIRPDEPTSTEWLAVMFTDLEGFTRFTARMGDEAAGDLLNAHHRAVNPVIRRRGGRVVKRLGDGLLLTFRDPAKAVRTAVELVDSEPGPLRLRAGIHAGDVMVVPDDVIGHTVNVAARVAELARGGQVLVTGDVRAKAPGVEFSRLRRRHLKGLDEPVAVCRVTSFG